MDNKQFNEIMREYAKSEKSPSNKAFSKLVREERKTSKNSGKQHRIVFACAAILTVIVLTLSITLPIVLNKKDSGEVETPQTTYCTTDDLSFRLEDSIDVLKNVYGVNAMYPTFDADITSVLLVSSSKYQGLNGCKINYVAIGDVYLEVDFIAIKRDYIVNTYSHYHDLDKQVEWHDMAVKYDLTYDEESGVYINTVYFLDNDYNYYIRTESDDEISAIDLLDLMFVKYYKHIVLFRYQSVLLNISYVDEKTINYCI